MPKIAAIHFVELVVVARGQFFLSRKIGALRLRLVRLIMLAQFARPALMALLDRMSFLPFVIYRVLLGIAILAAIPLIGL